MPTYTWNDPSLGQFVDWNTPADWLPQGVPNAADADVLIPEITEAGGIPYNFDVTIASGESFLVNSLTLVEQSLELDGALAVGAGLTLGQGGEVDIEGSLSVGSLSNAAATTIQGFGQISSAGYIDNQGQIADSNLTGVVGVALTLDFAGLLNTGTLVAEDMLAVDVPSAPGAFANLSDGTLSLGTYEAAGGVLQLNVGAAITTDAATIAMASSGAGSEVPIIETGTSGEATFVPLSQTLQTIAPVGVLALQATSFAAAAPLLDAGQLVLTDATLSTPGLTVPAGGTVTGDGTITGPVTNDGVMDVGPGGIPNPPYTGDALALGGPVAGSGTITILPENLYIEIPEGRPPDQLVISGADSNDVAFGDWNGELVLDSPAQFTGSISGYSTGTDEETGSRGVQFTEQHSDAILLPGLSADGVAYEAYVGNSAGGTLSFRDGPGSIALNFVGDYTESDFLLVAGYQALSTSPPSVEITELLPCFLAGTRLLTGRGEVPVERLTIGDMVRTPVGGGSAPIRWIGHRRVDARRHPRPPDVWPVRISAHAFGLGRPCRDLLLSPDHAVFVEGVLIPVRHLLNGAMVVQTRLSPADYFHVELPRHDIVLAEGLPTESYLDLGNRGAFDNGGGAVALHPEFGRRIWEREGCAELILGGPVLERVRAQLRVQARLLGCAAAGADAGLGWRLPVDHRRTSGAALATGSRRRQMPRQPPG